MQILVMVCFLAFGVYADELFKTSFDCSKIKPKTIEHKICSDKTLAQFDRELSNIYSSFYFITNEIKSDQITWIKKRNKCQNIDCIAEIYTQRIDELNTSLSNQNTFPKYVLDAMKEAQTTMQIQWDPIIFNKQHVEAGMQFKEKLFRFQNIRYKTPLIENVPYDDSKLKELLGSCYAYRFDLKIGRYPRNLIVDNQKYYLPDERKPIKEQLSFSVWKTYAKEKEWLFVKIPNTNISAYLVETGLCKQEQLNNDLAEALNNNSEQIKGAQFGFNNAGIVHYKDQELIFDLFFIQNHVIKFKIYEVLGVTSSEDATIQFAGTWLAIVPFKK